MKMTVKAREESKKWKFWGFAALLLGVLLIIVGFFLHGLIIYLGVGIILFSSYPFKKSKTWQKGAEGEEKIIEELEELGNEYEVFHDLVLPGKSQNIDHVVVGENGVFVLETKNLDGKIICDNDSWNRIKTGRKGTTYRGRIGSPSKQVKGNAVRLKNFLKEELPEIFEDKNIFFQGIVVFTDPNAELQISNPKVLITRTNNLIETIEKEMQKVLSSKEIEKIVRVLEKL